MPADTLEKFVVALGFDYDPKGLKKFTKDVDSVAKQVKGIATVLATGTAALFGFTAAVTSAADKQGKLADKIGVSVEDLSALQGASKLAGGSVDGLSSNLSALNRIAGEAAKGMGEGIETFGLLGVSIYDSNGQLKDTTRLLLDISGSMQGLSEAEQIALGEKLGLADTITLLQRGPSAIRATIAELKALGVTTKEDAILSAKFQDSLTLLLRVGSDIGRMVVRHLAPAFTSVMDRVKQWWVSNKALLNQKLPIYIDRLVLALKLLATATAAFLAFRMVSVILSLAKAFRAASASAALFDAVVGALPLLIGLAVAALALLAEDAKTFFEGGDSLIGDFIDRFPDLKEQVIHIAEVFRDLWDVASTGARALWPTIEETGRIMLAVLDKSMEGWGQLLPYILDLLKLILKGWKELFDFIGTTSLDNLKDMFALLWSDISDGLTALMTNIVGSISGAIDNAIGGAKKKLKEGFGKVLGFLGIDINTPDQPQNDMLQKLGEMSKSDLTTKLSNSAPMGPQALNTNSTSNVDQSKKIDIHTLNIQVSGAQSPQETGNAIIDELLRQAAEDIGSTTNS